MPLPFGLVLLIALSIYEGSEKARQRRKGPVSTLTETDALNLRKQYMLKRQRQQEKEKENHAYMMEEERSKSAKEEEISVYEEMQRKIKQAYEKVEDEAHQTRSRQSESQDWFSRPDLRSQKRLMALAVKSNGLEGERDKYTTAQLEDYERIVSTPSSNPLLELQGPRKRRKKIETSSSQDSDEKEENEYMKFIDSSQRGPQGKLHLPGLASKSADNILQDINDIEEGADESADDGEENDGDNAEPTESEGDESPPPAPPAAGFTPSKLK
mmetsp:Transcript_11676/g.18709  ORF Transcript_11676/g.18709 Transcript_11676/m.18709 type:complete len:270 (-) Transcript_11676:22-831(-)